MLFLMLAPFLWLAASHVLADQRNFTFNVGNTVLAPDGFSRSTVTVNGQFPGPLISVNKGDSVNINVVNNLTDPSMRRSTSVHWHGLLQQRNGFNDGPSFVTQCPISPSHSYPYQLQLGDQAGTYWYHSHLSSQYLDGLRGPFVINPNDPYLDLYDVDDETTVIVLADWFHTPGPTLSSQYLSTENTQGVEQLPQSGTINGVGRTSTDPTPARPVFKVTAGMRYRFRLINASGISRFDFQIQGHNFTVIEADGENTLPLTVDRLTIYAGQRYSIVLDANQPVDNYWIRAPMSAHVQGTPPTNWATDSDNVNAVLRYDGAPEAEPTSAPPALSGVNLDESDLVPLINPAAPGQDFIGGADKVFNLTFTGSLNQTRGWGFEMNGSRYTSPDVPTLLKILSGARNDTDFDPSENTHVIKRGDVVEINLQGAPNHPFHLHGHSFSVIKGATGPANFVNPPRRDVVATGSSAITIRFVADNPGPWFLHCHIDLHLEGGLAMVFAEDPDGIASGPDQLTPSDEWNQLCPIYAALSSDLQ